MTYIRSTWAAALLGLGLFAAAAPGETISVPFIFWGGDVATFVANGGTGNQGRLDLRQDGAEIPADARRRLRQASRRTIWITRVRSCAAR